MSKGATIRSGTLQMVHNAEAHLRHNSALSTSQQAGRGRIKDSVAGSPEGLGHCCQLDLQAVRTYNPGIQMQPCFCVFCIMRHKTKKNNVELQDNKMNVR